MNDSPLLIKIFHEIRILQKRNMFVSSAYGSSFSLSEAHIMVEVSENPRLSTNELSKIVGLERSTIARAVTTLIKNGFLVSSPAKEDKRKRELHITKHGEEALRLLDQTANANVEKFSSHLKAKEKENLAQYFRILGDSLNAAPSPLRRGESPLRQEVRRITRAVGLLGENFMESGLTSTQWQILSEVSVLPPPVLSSTIASELQFSPPNMSSAIKRLINLGYITAKRRVEDQRTIELTLIQKGREILQTIDSYAKNLLLPLLEKLNSNELKEFLSLFTSYVEDRTILEAANKDTLQVKKIRNPEERRIARSFLILELSRSNAHTSAPETLIGKNSHTFGLYEENTLRGVTEIQRNGKEWLVANFAVAKDLVNTTIAKDFLSRTIDIFGKDEKKAVKIRKPN